VFEVEDEAETAYLDLPEGAEVTWLLRSDGSPGLLGTVEALGFPDGRVHAFVHGELATMRELRRHLLEDRGVPLADLSLSGYWRHGKDEEGFQAEKAEEARAG
jgi:NADPH-dependent ferric siderophore reductase